MSIHKLIKGHQLFQALAFEEVERVSTFSGPKSYEAGDFIFEEGRRGTHFFIVQEGGVELLVRAQDEFHTHVVGRLSVGDILGVSPLLGFERYSTTARCKKPTNVLAVEVDAFRRLLDDNPATGKKLIEEMARTYFARYIKTLGRFQKAMSELALR